jgi:hypothetical protein
MRGNYIIASACTFRDFTMRESLVYADVSRKPIGPVFKVKVFQEQMLSLSAGKSYQSTLNKIPEERISVSLKLWSVTVSLSDTNEQIN